MIEMLGITWLSVGDGHDSATECLTLCSGSFHSLQVTVYHPPWVWFLAWAVTFVCLVTLAYNERARRSYPINYITLCIFTVVPFDSARCPLASTLAAAVTWSQRTSAGCQVL